MALKPGITPTLKEQLELLASLVFRTGTPATKVSTEEVLDFELQMIAAMFTIVHASVPLFGQDPPAPALGQVGDVYYRTNPATLYYKETTGWSQKIYLKAADGTTPIKGQDYFDGDDGRSAYQQWLDAGNTGNEAAFLASLVGRSAWQHWQDEGNQGTVADFLASLHGQDGADGNKNRWESYAPTNEAGRVGDAWFYAISATKIAIYECIADNTTPMAAQTGEGVAVPVSPWRLRFTSPDAATGTGTGGTNGVNLTSSGDGTRYLANDGTYKAVQAGATVVVEPNLSSNSTTAAPSVAAVKSAVEAIVTNRQYTVSITQTQTKVPLYYRVKTVFLTHSFNYNVATVVFNLSYLDTNGDEVRFGPFNSLGGTSGLNSAINALTDSIVATFGYTVTIQYTLKPGRSTAESTLLIQPLS